MHVTFTYHNRIPATTTNQTPRKYTFNEGSTKHNATCLIGTCMNTTLYIDSLHACNIYISQQNSSNNYEPNSEKVYFQRGKHQTQRNMFDWNMYEHNPLHRFSACM
ncbi:uncharacterized protein [Musca autumnalis]|uniref:uncharacterized protein n=1 Tax=Musca autumnalis TaxID=221902 RepID=UPI003CF6F45A